MKRILSSRFVYGFFFCVVVPFLLYWGAVSLEPFVELRSVKSVWGGGTVFALGLCMLSVAMLALKTKGGGLPMNAYPPPRFVATGIYRLIPHPIYAGFCLMVAGISMMAGSAAGLYVMTPLAMLGCMSIVWGYERQGLVKRFGKVTPDTLVSLPPDNDESLSHEKKLATSALIGMAWALAYFGGALTGIIDGAPSCRLFGEEHQPVILQSVWIYQSIYVIAPVLLLLLIRTNSQMRRFAMLAYGSFGLGLAFFLLVPLSCTMLAFDSESWAGWLLKTNRASLPVGCIAFPSFHVLWALLIAWFLWTEMPRIVGIAGVIWLILLSWSCVATGMHGYLDVLGSLVAFGIVVTAPYWARWSLKISCKLANSWKAWRLGPYRIINHGFFVFLSAAMGIVLATSLAGREYLSSIVVVSVCALLGAGIWAQLLEGSARLLRPFGYFGAIFGGIFGVVLMGCLHHWVLPVPKCLPGASAWVLFASLAAASPFVQACGRLRCLVQGCCHGHPIGDGQGRWGIVHVNPESRVCKLTTWRGVPLHATPLYSIFFNLIIGIFLLRLWASHMPAGMIIGFYFVLSGLARFVEEAYRGEPQTGHSAGLSNYQWIAAGFVLFGLLTWYATGLWPALGADVHVPSFSWHSPSLVWGGLIGLLYAFCMSTDFPDSNRRFSRLTS